MDKQILENQIAGLKASIKKLGEQKDTHIKLQTILEQIEKARVEQNPYEQELLEVKEEKVALNLSKTLTLSETATQLADKITTFLPNGSAVLRIDEDGVFIGLQHHGNVITPYLSLSGGEKAFFDLALCHALLGAGDNVILCAECAEVDNEKLESLLKEIIAQKSSAQVILNSCHEPENIPDGWKVTRL